MVDLPAATAADRIRRGWPVEAASFSKAALNSLEERERVGGGGREFYHTSPKKISRGIFPGLSGAVNS